MVVPERVAPSFSYLALVCLGYLERTNSTIIEKFITVPNSIAGQGKTLFLLVIEDNKYQFNL
jgi:hypothetical protein